MSGGPPPEVAAAITRALLAAMVADVRAMARSVEMLMRHGHAALFFACMSWADAVRMFTMTCDHEHCADPDGEHRLVAGVQILHGPDGRVIEPEQVPPEVAPAVWAGRFIAACANDDKEMALALYKAVQGEQLAAGIFYLLRMAGAATAGPAQARG